MKRIHDKKQRIEMDKKKKKIGWKHSGSWNGMELYSPDKAPGYAIFEYAGGFGIVNPFNDGHFIECSLTEAETEEFTDLAIRMADANAHPDRTTVAAYNDTLQAARAFVRRMRDKEKELKQ